ncbi:MAG: hypothetical protein IJN84_04465 [Clostridia bacterium]|nr:hypothetical protein [Clostridia bacterium]
MKKGIILAAAVALIIAVALIFSPKAEEISLYDAILCDIEYFYGVSSDKIVWDDLTIFAADDSIEDEYRRQKDSTSDVHKLTEEYILKFTSDIKIIDKAISENPELLKGNTLYLHGNCGEYEPIGKYGEQLKTFRIGICQVMDMSDLLPQAVEISYEYSGEKNIISYRLK